MTVGGSPSGTGSRHPVKIFANIFISFIGAGVLGLPFAFKEAGILEGILVMTLVGLISVKAMLLIIECKYQLIRDNRVAVPVDGAVNKDYIRDHDSVEDGLKTSSKSQEEMVNLIEEHRDTVSHKDHKEARISVDLSYGDVGYHALGHVGRVFVDVAIIISQAGFCCAYLIFISENLSDYFPHMKIVHWLCILLPPLSMMTLLRHLGSLALTSLMAQCSNLLAFAVVFWFDFEHIHNVEIHPKKMSIKGLPFFLCIAIYCYEGAGMILSLEGSLAADIRHKFKKFFVFTMFIVTTLYITFGCAGYLSFGPETNAIITLNLPKGESLDFAMIVKSFLCLALFFTYPVMMFPVMKILEVYMISDPGKSIWRGVNDIKTMENNRRVRESIRIVFVIFCIVYDVTNDITVKTNILRMSMVLITGCIVLVIPNFANLMALVGATCCTMLAFTLPGLFHMSIFKGSLTVCQVVIDWTLIFLGILGALIGTIDALSRLHSSSSESDFEIIPNNETLVATTFKTIFSTTTSGLLGVHGPGNGTNS